MKNYLLIYNPFSGIRNYKKNIEIIFCVFKQNDINLKIAEIYDNQRNNQINNIMVDVEKSYDAIIIMGGDGTIAEVINYIINNKISCPIGLIPSGTCNDFISGLGFNKNLALQAELLCKGKPILTDIGYYQSGNLTERYFINNIEGGDFSSVSYATNPKWKARFGILAYYWQTIKKIGKIHAHSFKVIDDKNKIYENNAYVFLVLNGSCFAGMKSLLPQAIMNDGKLDIIILKKLPLHKLPKLIYQFLHGQTAQSEYIIHLQSSSFDIEASNEMDSTIDGEKGFPFPYHIKTVNNAVSIIKTV